MVRDRPILLLIFLIMLILVGLVALTWANYRFAVQSPGGNDFLARWMGARMWLMEGISPYDPRVSMATQEMIYGRPADASKWEDLGHFVYPLYSMIFFAPFGLFEYLLARALWMTLLEVGLAALAILSLRLVGWQLPPSRMALLAVFSLLWYHGLRSVIVGQFAVIGAVLIVGALLLIQREHDFEAGILLALATSKPQMVILIIPFVLMWGYSQRRFRLFGGFFGGMAALVLVMMIFIPNWPLQMIWQIMDYPSYSNRIGLPTSIIAGWIPGLSQQLYIGLNSFFWVYLLVEWVLAWKKGSPWFTWTALMTLTITNFIVRTATANYAMLLPVIFLIFKIWEERLGRVGRWVVWAVTLLFFIGLWVLFINTVDDNLEQPAMYLPLPLFSLFFLWWGRWWAIRPLRLPIENYRD